MLKAELHIHTNADPRDKIQFSIYELIDKAAEQNYNVLGITCHNYAYYDKEAKEYAKNKGIILISGMEMDLEGKHTLIYNITNTEAKKIKTFQDLQKLKEQKLKEEEEKIFVIAAHPYHLGTMCLKNNIIKHLSLFDAWEYSFFYTRYLNPNNKTIRLAKKHQKPIVGSSDVHYLKDLGRTYTLIDSEKEESEIFEAIKAGRTKVVTKPLPTSEFLKIFGELFSSTLRRKII